LRRGALELGLYFRDHIESIPFSSLAASAADGEPPQPRDCDRRELLSWGCPSTPLRRHSRSASCPTSSSEDNAASAQGSHPPNTFRPCRFSRLRRFALHTGSRACCIPLPTMGFARFRRTPPAACIALFALAGRHLSAGPPPTTAGPFPEPGSGGRTAVCSLLAAPTPHWRLTLRSVPLDDSRTASPQPLPPRRWPASRPATCAGARPTSTSGPCSIIESVAQRCVSTPQSPILPWAWHSTKPSPHLAATRPCGRSQRWSPTRPREFTGQDRLCTYPLPADAASETPGPAGAEPAVRPSREGQRSRTSPSPLN
jgi:hypothetical protein